MAKTGSFMPNKTKINTGSKPIHVGLVAIPDAMLSSLSGLYDVLNCFELLGSFDDTMPDKAPFLTEIVSQTHENIKTASGLHVATHCSFGELQHVDIVIIPSLFVEGGEWRPGRYPIVVKWLLEMHNRGAILCSACSGVMLLAETGLLDGRETTIHYSYAQTFQRNFPKELISSLKKFLSSRVIAGNSLCQGDPPPGTIWCSTS